jgi:arsenate reductase
MAEGLLRHEAGDRFEVHSAGTMPSGMSEITVAAMRELGIDISSQWSKSVNEFAGQKFDCVITVCDQAEQVCPSFPGEGERSHWNIEDPSDTEARGVPLIDAFRIARDDLRARIEEFVRGR